MHEVGEAFHGRAHMWLSGATVVGDDDGPSAIYIVGSALKHIYGQEGRAWWRMTAKRILRKTEDKQE